MFLALKLNSNPKTNPPVSCISSRGCKRMEYTSASRRASKESMTNYDKSAEMQEIKE